MNKNIVWSIAGSDCSGGAGIQADTKTLHNLGVEAGSVITAVTAQNRHGVQHINAVNNKTLLTQLQALEQDKPAKIIKIGLLANIDQVTLVAKQLNNYKTQWSQPPTVIYDPVSISSTGGHLTEENILPTVINKLLPLVDILTPNAIELQQLTGLPVSSWSELQLAADKIIKDGAKAVIAKGGHIHISPVNCVDYCVNASRLPHQHYWLVSDRIHSQNTHGTGCTFASAIAALLARDYLLRDAFTIAKAYINQAIDATRNNCGSGGAIWQGPWPTAPDHYPRVLIAGSDLANSLNWSTDTHAQNYADNFASLETKKVGFYPVVDSLEWLERLLKIGVDTIQYRQKKLHGEALEQELIQAITMGKQYNTRLFINDHWPLAIKHQAYGVHLGQEDLTGADLGLIKQAGLRLGISTHGHYEFLKAIEYAPSYLAIGAIFPTTTKNMTGQIQGITTLVNLLTLNHSIPVVAIGGISPERAKLVAATGVSGIAVVSAVTSADDPQSVVEHFIKTLANNEHADDTIN